MLQLSASSAQTIFYMLNFSSTDQEWEQTGGEKMLLVEISHGLGNVTYSGHQVHYNSTFSR